jgi:hypothetical protein
VFIDNDLDEDDLLDGLFDVEAVEMLKSKTCMLCSRDFSMFGGTKEQHCSRCGKAVCA